MSYNPNAGMNSLLRRAGNRSRMAPPGQLPDIGQMAAPPEQSQQGPPGFTPPPGFSPQATLPPQASQRAQSVLGQTPAVQALNAGMGQMPGMQPQPMPQPAASPMAAPAVQPNTLMLHPPGVPADPNQYNYEPQPNGAWLVYPPGVSNPAHTTSASLPRAASTADYRRMREAFQQPQMAVSGQAPMTVPPAPVPPQ